MREIFRFFAVVCISLGLALGLAKTTKDTFFDVARISNESMLPYLRPGQFVVILKTNPCFRLPFFGAPIACSPCELNRAYVFRHPRHTEQRLVKFAGDHIQLKGDQGLIRRDIIWFTERPAGRQGSEQCYFLGSNQEKSVDSRQFGPVSVGLVEGMIIYPPTKFAGVLRHD
jgi:signal peptidase I